jgi:hypothetical protein
MPEFFSNNYRLSQSQQLGLKLRSKVFACKIQVLCFIFLVSPLEVTRIQLE